MVLLENTVNCICFVHLVSVLYTCVLFISVKKSKYTNCCMCLYKHITSPISQLTTHHSSLTHTQTFLKFNYM